MRRTTRNCFENGSPTVKLVTKKTRKKRVKESLALMCEGDLIMFEREKSVPFIVQLEKCNPLLVGMLVSRRLTQSCPYERG